jgi:hypothetical protein
LSLPERVGVTGVYSARENAVYFLGGTPVGPHANDIRRLDLRTGYWTVLKAKFADGGTTAAAAAPTTVLAASYDSKLGRLYYVEQVTVPSSCGGTAQAFSRLMVLATATGVASQLELLPRASATGEVGLSVLRDSSILIASTASSGTTTEVWRMRVDRDADSGTWDGHLTLTGKLYGRLTATPYGAALPIVTGGQISAVPVRPEQLTTDRHERRPGSL